MCNLEVFSAQYSYALKGGGHQNVSRFSSQNKEKKTSIEDMGGRSFQINSMECSLLFRFH